MLQWRSLDEGRCVHIAMVGPWPTADEVRSARALLRAAGLATAHRAVLLDFRQVDCTVPMPSVDELCRRSLEWVHDIGAPAGVAFLTTGAIDAAAQAYLAAAIRVGLPAAMRSFTDEPSALGWLKSVATREDTGRIARERQPGGQRSDGPC